MAKRRRTRQAKKDEAPGWVWMLFGLAIGLIVALAVYVNGEEQSRRNVPSELEANVPPRQPETAPARAESRPSARPTAESDASRFGFYDMLPRLEVVVPEIETPQTTASKAVAIEKPGTYVLQAGSFRRHADADQQKARIALLGIESRIQIVTIDNDTFHRVRIGPTSDLDELNRIRRRLIDANVESVVMELRAESE
jgi:cell division protein FtsN